MASLSPYAQHAFVPETQNDSWANMFGFIPDGSRVLDVGCSTGNFGAALAEHKGCTVVGVDLNEADIEVAVGRLSAAYVLDVLDPDARQRLGRFDVIVFGDVIEHLLDPRAVLSVMHELLAEGGVIVYSIPHMGHFSVRADLIDGRFPYTDIGLLDRTHLHFYDRQEVFSVFEDAGFTIDREKPTTAVFPRSWIESRLSAMGLSAADSFFAMLEATDAHVFQYVGVAVPRGDAPRRLRQPDGELAPDEISRRTDELIVENERLRHELDGLHRRIELLRRNPVAGVASELRRRVTRRS